MRRSMAMLQRAAVTSATYVAFFVFSAR